MKLYISNCTHQTHFFNYKLPERMQPHGIMIKPGKQEVLEHPPEAIHYIIEQHAAYGFTDIKNCKPGFSGICYSIDKPVTSSQILAANEQKQEDLENVSQEILENSAAALTQTIENTMRQAGSDENIGDVEMKITGEAINKEVANPPKLEKKITVTKDASRATPARAGRGGRAGRATKK